MLRSLQTARLDSNTMYYRCTIQDTSQINALYITQAVLSQMPVKRKKKLPFKLDNTFKVNKNTRPISPKAQNLLIINYY